MPKLESEQLTWTIRYHNANSDWYYYRMTLHWQGQPVINPSIRYPSDDGIPRDEFGICQNDYDGLRELFDRALSTNKPCAWDSLEPATRIAIYPGTMWPFCPERWECNDQQPIEDLIEWERRRFVEAASPNGVWTVMILIDSENFRNADLVTGDGLVLTLSTERQEIERFRREIEIEHREFSKRIGCN
ncbi:MAG: hypothetical protein RRC34_15950 [Lentisphaeria bacterium]|nr:hypothetical protein [Lentisphaeria bacterium]